MAGLIIFDVDGVFRDSSLAMDEGFRRGFSAVGLTYPFKVHGLWRLRGIGKYLPSTECAKALFAIRKSGKNLGKIIESPDAEKVLDRIVAENISKDDMVTIEKINGIYKEYFTSPEAKKHIIVFEFCKETLSKLSENYALAVVSNSWKKTIERDLGELTHYFSLIIGKEDVREIKPSGEGILKVMEILDFRDKSNVFYVGDSKVDMIAGRDAGVKLVAVLSGMETKRDLEKAKPDLIFENILEMAKRI